MSTSETPTNRPSKVRASKTEPRFKIPVRTELDRSPSLEQVMTDSVVKFLCILFMFMCEKGIDVLISTGFLAPLNYSLYFLFENDTYCTFLILCEHLENIKTSVCFKNDKTITLPNDSLLCEL